MSKRLKCVQESCVDSDDEPMADGRGCWAHAVPVGAISECSSQAGLDGKGIRITVLVAHRSGDAVRGAGGWLLIVACLCWVLVRSQTGLLFEEPDVKGSGYVSGKYGCCYFALTSGEKGGPWPDLLGLGVALCWRRRGRAST